MKIILNILALLVLILCVECQSPTGSPTPFTAYPTPSPLPNLLVNLTNKIKNVQNIAAWCYIGFYGGFFNNYYIFCSSCREERT